MLCRPESQNTPLSPLLFCPVPRAPECPHHCECHWASRSHLSGPMTQAGSKCHLLLYASPLITGSSPWLWPHPAATGRELVPSIPPVPGDLLPASLLCVPNSGTSGHCGIPEDRMSACARHMRRPSSLAIMWSGESSYT